MDVIHVIQCLGCGNDENVERRRRFNIDLAFISFPSEKALRKTGSFSIASQKSNFYFDKLI